MRFIHFFEQITTLQKLSWVFGCLFFCWLLEAGIPLFKHSYNKWKHDGINLVFFSFSALINLVIGLLAVGVFVWIDAMQSGLLHWVALPVWLEVLIAVMALDLFGQYVIHFMLHRVKWMWKMQRWANGHRKNLPLHSMGFYEDSMRIPGVANGTSASVTPPDLN